jgi:ABC-type multidrug transport system fused ATPase/permease subunit
MTLRLCATMSCSSRAISSRSSATDCWTRIHLSTLPLLRLKAQTDDIGPAGPDAVPNEPCRAARDDVGCEVVDILSDVPSGGVYQCHKAKRGKEGQAHSAKRHDRGAAIKLRSDGVERKYCDRGESETLAEQRRHDQPAGDDDEDGERVLPSECDRDRGQDQCNHQQGDVRVLLALDAEGERNQALRRHLAVNDLSFDVKPGQVTGFLGPNGAGSRPPCA